MSSAHLDRVAAVLRKHEYNGRDDGAQYCICGWASTPEQHDHESHVAQAVIEALELTEHFAVSSGERREFEQFDTRDQAERGLHCHVTNSEHWQAKGREIPLWARDPRIETRLVSPWRADGED